MKLSHRILISSERDVAEARKYVRRVAHGMAQDDSFSEKSGVITTEMASNLVRHAGGGEFIVRELPSGRAAALELLALDRGDGMSDVNECMRDGYSTHGQAGTGLGAIQRLSDRFEIHSVRGLGTAVWVEVHTALAPPMHSMFEVGAVSVPADCDGACGDAWEFVEAPAVLRVIVAEGRGTLARRASMEALRVFREAKSHPPGRILQTIHGALADTQGAAGAIVELHAGLGQATCAGVGNISMRLGPAQSMQALASGDGTLGHELPEVEDEPKGWTPDMLLVMHSDGLASRWTLHRYGDLIHHHPALIAGVLYRDFKQMCDDATVVVARYRP
jgi:anti-sigma regulatory factor (Ser/Thr protein kinase)